MLNSPPRRVAMDRVDILKDWMAREGRKAKWVAAQIDCSDTWLSYILNRRRVMSDKIARALQEKLQIPFDDLPRAKRATKRPRRQEAREV
jgi:antitoxin component HigA of HigAB toxin-antitoxin module